MKIGDLEWSWTAWWPLFCVISGNSIAYGAHCVIVVQDISKLFMVALCNRADHYIFILFLSSFFLSFFLLLFFLAYSQRSEIGCLPYFGTLCGLSANLECRSEMYCTRLAANTGRKKIAISAPSHNFVGSYLRNWGMYRQSEKNTLSSNNSSTCPDNMVNFGPLTAEIVSGVWGTPTNFSVTARHLVVGVSQTLWRWTEGVTYVRQGDHRVGHWPTF